MRWPNDTPDAVKALAERILAVLEGSDVEVVGPAISLAFGYVILDLGGHGEDVAALDGITDDITQLVLRYNAAVARPMH
jgi:hypothetical protein